MTRVLYELAGRDGRMFSPYCWRTILALLHKGLDFARAPVTFTDRAAIAPSGHDRLPVLRDGETWVGDSWRIACRLEDRYPEAPSLFGGAVGRAEARFFNTWVDHAVHAPLRRIVVPDVFAHVHPDDRDWFRKTREATFGMPLEAMRAERAVWHERLTETLAPVRATLEGQPYLCGEEPAYADYILFGTLMWPRSASPYPLFAAGDPIRGWRACLLDRFDGYARRAPSYDV